MSSSIVRKWACLDRLLGFDEFDLADAFDKERVAKICHPEHKGVSPISYRDDCFFREDQRVVLIL